MITMLVRKSVASPRARKQTMCIGHDRANAVFVWCELSTAEGSEMLTVSMRGGFVSVLVFRVSIGVGGCVLRLPWIPIRVLSVVWETRNQDLDMSGRRADARK